MCRKMGHGPSKVRGVGRENERYTDDYGELAAPRRALEQDTARLGSADHYIIRPLEPQARHSAAISRGALDGLDYGNARHQGKLMHNRGSAVEVEKQASGKVARHRRPRPARPRSPAAARRAASALVESISPNVRSR